MFGSRRTPLAWLVLTHGKTRLLSSAIGVGFAAVLMFLEMGFLNGLFDSETEVVRLMNADVILISKQKEAVLPQRPFPKRRLSQALGQPEVRAAYPIYLREFCPWKDPKTRRDHPILIYAFNPNDPVFLIPEVLQNAALLKRRDTALLDSRAKDLFGDRVAGVTGELGHQAIHVVGTFPLGADFRIDGNMLLGEQTFFKCFGNRGPSGNIASQVEFGLLKIVQGADPVRVRDDLQKRLPGDVQVLTKQDFIDQVKSYWANAQPVGYVFGMGTVVGFLIGVTICYQILYTDIMDHLPQYATLKAMGYSNGYLVKVVIQEGVYLGCLGFLPGLLVSLGAYTALQAISGILMFLTLGRVVLILVLTVLMCALAGLLAIRTAIRSDPAECFG
jgi:putative ABC transport system permease protein